MKKNKLLFFIMCAVLGMWILSGCSFNPEDEDPNDSESVSTS